MRRLTNAAAWAIWSGRRTCTSRPMTGGAHSLALPGADLEHLGITRSEDAASEVQFLHQPTPRFHGSVPAMLEEVQEAHCAKEPAWYSLCLTRAKWSGWPTFSPNTTSRFRLGSRTRGGESYADETAYFARRGSDHHAGESLRSGWRRAPRCAPGHFWRARSVRRIGVGGVAPAAAEVESLGVPVGFPRPAGGRLRGPRRARHRAIPGTEGNQSGRRSQRNSCCWSTPRARGSTFR